MEWILEREGGDNYRYYGQRCDNCLRARKASQAFARSQRDAGRETVSSDWAKEFVNRWKLREDRQIELEVSPDNVRAQNASAHVGDRREDRNRIVR